MGCWCDLGDVDTTHLATSQMQKKPEMYIEKEQLISLRTNQNEFIEAYTLGNIIGKGQNGEVREAIHKRTFQKRAVKIIKKSALDNVHINGNDLLSEYKMLRSLDHPNIMRIYETFMDESTIYIAMEYLGGGNLLQRIEAYKRPFSEKQARVTIFQILSGLNYCHNKKVAHRDIKSENIMFASQDPNSACKIVDFTFATLFNSNNAFQEMMGSPIYMSPQVISGNKHTEKCDIWSLGIVAYFLFTGRFPYKATTFDDLKREISYSRFSFETFKDIKGISENAKMLLAKMLAFNEVDRIGTKFLIEDPWFQEELKEPHLSEAESNEIYNSMMSVKNMHIMQRAVLEYISLNIDMQEEAAKLGNLFRSMDKNRTGKLSKDQIRDTIKKLKNYDIPDKDINAVFSQMDSNKDNMIEFTEFLSVAMSQQIGLKEQNIKIAFDFFDMNHDGKITSSELSKIFQCNFKEKNAEITKIIQSFDRDKNNELSFEEFKQMMREGFKKN